LIDQDDEVLPPKNTTKSKSKHAPVLGRDLLSEVRQDMERIQLPTWVSRTPNHPGESDWGKFTADNWRSFCLINLPITLTRLWGGKPRESREYRMLDNYMHLITAIKLATSRNITAGHISAYQAHMHAYLKSLLILYNNTSCTSFRYPSRPLRPNTCMALFPIRKVQPPDAGINNEQTIRYGLDHGLSVNEL